jgi:GT2 family glycosyltransferase
MPGSDDTAVVIATRDRRDRLLTTLALLRSGRDGPPVVVVDNASHDGTREAVRREFPDVAVIASPTNLGAAARNLGVAAAARPFVAFCDDDTWWEPDALDRARAQLVEDTRVAIVTGRVLVEPSGHTDPTCALMAESPIPQPDGLAGRAVVGFLAGASMVRTSAFLAVGGYDARWGIGAEEKLLALDLLVQGWVVSYAHDVVVHHAPHGQRDARQRTVMQRRNELWCAWLRYDHRGVVRETLRHARESWSEGLAGPVLRAAARGLPWIVRERRVLPASVLDLVRVCDRVRDDRARRTGAVNRRPAQAARASATVS